MIPIIVLIVAMGLALAIARAWTPDRSVESLATRWARPPSTFIPLDGMQVHLRDEGVRDDPTPVVLLHGTGSSLHTWQGWADRLAPTRRVIRLDRPGFGLTGPNPKGDYTMAYYVGFLDRLLDALGIESCVLVGNSSGGRMAWEYAAAKPARVHGLVLLAAAGYPRTTPLPTGLRIAMSPIGPLLLHLISKSVVRKGLESNYGDPAKLPDVSVDWSYEITMRRGVRAALGETLRQAEAVDDSALIPQVRAPALIIWGDRDTVIPPADAQRFHADLQNSRLLMLPGVGHLPQEEAPDETVAAFRDFAGAA